MKLPPPMKGEEGNGEGHKSSQYCMEKWGGEWEVYIRHDSSRGRETIFRIRLVLMLDV